MKRREALKTLSAVGFNLLLYSCTLGEDEDGKPTITIKKTIAADSLKNLPTDFSSDHVIYIEENQEQYEELRAGFNKRIDKKPKIIALCKNTIGVSEAIKRANIEGLKVAVKSGGHSFEGFSSIENGMQINLSLLKNMELTEENHLIIEPAALLKEIYDYLLPKKRLLPAGSCGTVGIGGLALGGGYGFFSRKMGLTCDHLLEAEFVDAKGNIHATKNNKELNWALRGGGNGNFGVVTKFTFQTQEAPSHFTRYRFKAYKLTPERTKKLLQAYFTYSSKLSKTCFAAFVLNYKTMVLLITNYEEEDEALKEMLDVFSTLSDKTELGLKKDLADSLKNYYGIQYPIYFKNASAGYYNDYSDIETSIDAILEKVFAKSGLIYQINTLGGAINSPRFEEASCYPHRSYGYLSELQAYWEKPSQESYLSDTFDAIQSILYTNGITKQYRNYPFKGFQNWQQAYYGENYAKLQEIKQKYDPKNVFSFEQSIELKETT